MIYLPVALVCALIGVLPLILRRKMDAAIIWGVIAFIIIWTTSYASTPTTVWPLFGIFGLWVVFFWAVTTIMDIGSQERVTPTILFPVGGVLIFVGSLILGSGMFRAQEYASLLGSMEPRVWTQDIQPKDPKHMRMATRENAVYLAGKTLGEAGAIGSQFQVSEKHMTLQRIKGELWYVAPLDFADFRSWNGSNGSPGYVMVHGEDPNRRAILKQLPEGQRLRFTPGAWFGDELERYLRNNGFLNIGLAEYKFEIDEDGKPWWVIPTFTPTIMWNGEKITGVVMVDPINGDTTFKPLDEIPGWIERVIPAFIVKQNIAWQGDYHDGWLNRVWIKKGLTEPEEPNLIYASDDTSEWVTGVTSTNASDASLIAVIYTNSRTGKSVYYETKGGSTDYGVVQAVDSHQDVQFKKLHGVDPQLYNVYGTMASVVPLLNENHAYQGLAIVDVMNIQTIAVGSNQQEAVRRYQQLMSRSGQQVSLDKTRGLETIEGIVDRFASDVISTGTAYYLHVENVPHLFTGGSTDSIKIPVTKLGDRVKIEYFASGEDVVPMRTFDNLSLVLQTTAAQTQVREHAEERRVNEEVSTEAQTVLEQVKNLTPEQMRELGKKLPANR